jgi:uncharacterized membrane protein (Fun14 family)
MMEQEMIDVTTSPPTSPGLLDTLKERFDMQGVIQKAKLSKDKIYEAGLYAGIGLVCGYLIKRYSAYVVMGVLALLGLWVLQQYGVVQIAVNWDKVYEVFGIQVAQDVTADTVIGMVWEWMKVNMVISISYLVGFFIGLRLG